MVIFRMTQKIFFLLLQKIEEGYDVVSGWRKDRKDPFLTRRLPSMIANKIISSLEVFTCTIMDVPLRLTEETF